MVLYHSVRACLNAYIRVLVGAIEKAIHHVVDGTAEHIPTSLETTSLALSGWVIDSKVVIGLRRQSFCPTAEEKWGKT